jgi:hypothetical protein
MREQAAIDTTAAERQEGEECRDKPSYWRVADQVVLDLEFPHLDVQAAVRAQDESLLWRAWRGSRDQKFWVDGLAASVGSHVNERPHLRDSSRTTPWHHVLIAWPVILPAASRARTAATSDDRKATGGLLDKLQWWLGYRHEARLLAGVTEYAQICRFSPLWQRECLQILGRQPPGWRAPLRADGLRLGASFPRLAFVVGSVSEWIVAPEIGSDESGERDWPLQMETAARVGYMHGSQVAPANVGVPAAFAHAVLAGLRAWMRELVKERLVRGWQLDFGFDDTVVLQLPAANENSAGALIPIRLHQIGMQGLQVLLEDLQQLLGPADRAPAHA